MQTQRVMGEVVVREQWKSHDRVDDVEDVVRAERVDLIVIVLMRIVHHPHDLSSAAGSDYPGAATAYGLSHSPAVVRSQI